MKRYPLVLLCVSLLSTALHAATPEERARDLVSRMTLEEKSQQVGHVAPAIPRLGVPAYNWWNEGLHGVARAGIATVFPQAIGMAASWDAPLMHEVADAISTEFRAKYLDRVGADGSTDWYRGLTVWSPNINIFRDPRWGRGQETYGEDPYLTARMGIAFVTGLQGDDPHYLKVVSTSKHYAVHSGPESNRHREDVHPSAHDLEDTYLPAFRATVTEGKVGSIMCAYNAVDGLPACASPDLLEAHLRKAWGFKGYVVSDCGAAANIYRDDSLRYAKNPEEAVAAAFKAGMDLICGDYRNQMNTEAEPIVTAVKQGLLPQAVLDQALVRLFTARFRLGMFDPKGSAFPAIGPKDFDTEAHAKLAVEMARHAMVLLKNHDNLLPLTQAPATIAVIGPNADSLDALEGNYQGDPGHPVTVLDGIRARFPSSKILYAEGSGLVGTAEPAVPDAVLCADADCKTPGLKAEHFANYDYAGPAASTGTEANARISWAGEVKGSSARWSGYIRAPKSGEYRFRFSSTSGNRILIGGKPILDSHDGRPDHTPPLASGAVSLEGGKLYPITVEAIQYGAAGRQKLVWSAPGEAGEDAIAAAQQADLVIFVGGLSARVEGEEMKVEAPGFAGGDRTSLDLPAPQETLLERLQAVGKPVVLVLMNGSALAVNWADKNVPAIVEAWYPGGQGGIAVAELLAGDYSPAGRLPVTFYRSADQLPPFRDYGMKGRTYRYFTGGVLYPFGHGLSYTTFTYSAPKLVKRLASVTVTNSGSRESDEVVQLYVAKPGDSAKPVLAGFSRIHLRPGESRTVNFDLDDRALSQVDAKGERKLVAGTYHLDFGGGQPGYAKTVQAALSVVKEKTLAK